MILTYSELRKLKTYEERLAYLRLNGNVGMDTFGFDRIFNQKFYKSNEWKKVRDKVIIRDNGCDLGIEDRPIFEKILIHHMNPITMKDIDESSDFLLNPDYLVCVTHKTHNAIHYGESDSKIPDEVIERKQNDTCLWKQ